MDSPCGKLHYALDNVMRMRRTSSRSWADMAEEEEEDDLPRDTDTNVLLLEKFLPEADAEHSGSSIASTCASTAASPRRRADDWYPNADAPEFVPALTVPSPLVMDAHQPEGMASYDVPVFAVFPVAVFAAIPEHSCLEHRTSQEDAHASVGRKGWTRKIRRPAALSIPERKGSMPEQFEPAWSIGDSLACKQGVMPPATEEEWQRRIEMRWKAVELCRETNAYRLYNARKPRELREFGDPMTPDPTDRSVSKRTWKFNVHQWRLALMQFEATELDGDNSESTATTETGGSDPAADVLEIDADTESSPGSCTS